MSEPNRFEIGSAMGRIGVMKRNGMANRGLRRPPSVAACRQASKIVIISPLSR